MILSVVVSVVLMVWFLPRDTKFGYNYELGRPWLYSSLIAHYDFPIFKSESQLQADRDSALADFQPLFVGTDSMAKNMGRHLLSDWQAGKFKGVSYNQVAHVGRMLETVYAQGVVDNEQMMMLIDHKTKSIRLLNGNVAQSRKVGNLLTPLAAYEIIVKSDTVHFQRQDMARLKLSDYLKPNLHFDSIRTRKALKDVIDAVSPTIGMVQSGQKIIDRGDIIDSQTLLLLDSFKRESELRKDESSNYRYLLAGQIGVVLGAVLLMVWYLALFRKDVIESPHNIYMIFTLLTIFSVLSSLMVEHNFLSVYVLPYAMVPIFIRVFIDSRTASMQLAAMLSITSMSLHQPFMFLMTELVVGLVAIYSLRELTARAQIFKTALVVTLSALTFGLFFDFTQGATFGTLNTSLFFYKAISGVLLLFTYPLMYLVERLFGYTSDVTLVELTNINNPLLRRMSKEAQGTFVHSMQVANLAAEVANKIGAKGQMVRTGALYHDIGKLQNPAFFTENQHGNNPHDKLTEEQSAAIIISHVTEGLRMASQYNLPAEIREFINTHHGTSRTGFFYIQAVNRRGSEHVDAADFTYPGRNPYTREQAILMMTDAVEAASRSLKEYTEESIQELVNRIVDGQVQAGYFSKCPISFRDIDMAKQVFCESLKMIYHTRIAYPTLPGEKIETETQDSNRGEENVRIKGFRTTAFGFHRRTE